MWKNYSNVHSFINLVLCLLVEKKEEGKVMVVYGAEEIAEQKYRDMKW